MDFDETPVPDFSGLGRLDDQVFVVLGAGQGIGRQAAHALAQAGAHVVCVGRRDAATQHVADEVKGSAFIGDAQDRPTMVRLFAEIEARHGKLNGIVDIIAIGIAGGILTMGDEDLQWQFDNVLRHAYLALQIGAPLMAKSGGGSIVLVSSVAGHRVWTNPAFGYGIAKAALNHMVATAAVELGPLNIRVNAVAPGLVTTPRWQNQTSEWYEAVAEKYPLRRIGAPSDIGSVILFLATDLSRNMTGQNLVADGGLTLLSPKPVSDDASGWSKDMA
ncbi:MULTISPECIES: SDR family NAD(P)-dependent oxidoreductase [Sphingobium]|uniref:SDR family NAD(P)-dependent oxidoreductase n=1 Tax=Sphingobium TaxID=165695 RepID=UPI00159C5442|nr:MULTISPECIES: SDR family oxidoreductase [unclassified Sphingobium]